MRPQVLEQQLGLWPERRFWPGQSASCSVQRPDGDILEERIGAKEVWSAFDPKQRRVVEQPTPAEQARRSCLSHAEVHELVRLAVEIEMREGCPQDVEWAIDAHLPFPRNVFLLQHRPETSWAVRPAQGSG